MTIHILTAVHNDSSNLNKLIHSIANQTMKDYTLTIVDDGSKNEVARTLEGKFPNITILRGDGNLWWTGALNLGLNQILANADDNDYILTINVDCTISPTYLAKMTNMCGPARVVGSKIINRSGKIWDVGEIIDWRKGSILPRSKSSDPIDAISTKGTIYPVKMFREIGLLSKRLPHYLSDYELSVRAKKHNYQLIICDDCVVKNDTQNTGFGDIIPANITLKQAFQLLFSRKSKTNLLDQIWFITLSCPRKYKLINYLRLGNKLTKYVLGNYKLTNRAIIRQHE